MYSYSSFEHVQLFSKVISYTFHLLVEIVPKHISSLLLLEPSAKNLSWKKIEEEVCCDFFLVFCTQKEFFHNLWVCLN